MSKTTYPLKPLTSIEIAAAGLVKEDGVGAVETAADFFRQQAGHTKPEDLQAILARAPDQKPDAGDEHSGSSSG